jgi:hypothetical protein
MIKDTHGRGAGKDVPNQTRLYSFPCKPPLYNKPNPERLYAFMTMDK